jgi:hypothetical protein
MAELRDFKPPREKAHSTSVEVASRNDQQSSLSCPKRPSPGIDIKSRAIGAKGWPVACILVQYVIGSFWRELKAFQSDPTSGLVVFSLDNKNFEGRG